MIKSITIASTVFLISTGLASANGGSFVPPPPRPAGFYVGAGLNGLTSQTQVDAVATGPVTGPLASGFLYSRLWDIGGWGFNGQIFGGYKATFHKYYTWGVELFYDFGTFHGSYSENPTLEENLLLANVPGTFNITMGDTYGISFLPGIKLNDNNSLYARVGYANTDFILRDGAANGGGVIFGAAPISVSRRIGSIEVGVGLETNLFHNLDLRLEYDYFAYGGIINNPVVPLLNGFAPLPFNVDYSKYKPSLNKYSVAAVYRFYELPISNNIHMMPNGLYLGGAVGRQAADFKTTALNNDNGFISAKDFDWAGRGFDLEGFGGFARTVFNDYIRLGVEVYASWSSLRGQIEFASAPPIPTGLFFSTSGRIKIQSIYGASFMPGINVAPNTTVYLRVGWASGQFQLDDLGIDATGNVTQGFDGGVLNNFTIPLTNSKQGLELGIGAETMLSPHIGARAQYKVYLFGNIRQQQGPILDISGFPESGNVSFNAKVQEASFGLDWHFFS